MQCGLSSFMPNERTNVRTNVRQLLKLYGHNSSSYHLLKEDKQYFFSQKGVEGVIAFVEHAGVVLVAGDPLCSEQNMIPLIYEFRKYCETKKKDCCFQAITKKCRDVLDVMGFGYIKIGEEPFFDLTEWTIDGSVFKDVRNAAHHAENSGLKVIEYKPLEFRNKNYEAEIAILSRKWLSKKKTGEFTFLVGSPSLDDPSDRKYFLVVDSSNILHAFLVCVPIYARKGIYLDIMRYKDKPLRGTTELLIREVFRMLKDQGYALASLGSAPLADVTSDEQKKQLIQHALKFTYNNLNYFYRFKPLFAYKQQFGPTQWEPKYFAYYPPFFKAIFLYAILKSYDPSGIRNLAVAPVRTFWNKLAKLSIKARHFP
jgi:phosphatidylglycerol lysyltransferase